MSRPLCIPPARWILVDGRRIRIHRSTGIELYTCDRCGQGGHATLAHVLRCCTSPRRNTCTGKSQFLIESQEELT